MIKKKWKNRVLFTIVSANNTLYHRILTNLITELKSKLGVTKKLLTFQLFFYIFIDINE